jgi:hypothetical protein
MIGFIIVLSTVRMIQNEVRKGKKPDSMLWVLFSGIAFFAIATIAAGIYFVLLFNQQAA